MHRILCVLPNEFDRLVADGWDLEDYELHLFFASSDTKDATIETYGPYLAHPGFLTSYVDRAVDYVRANGITAILFSHDMASVVASVICQRTGLRGPSLESTFCSLHKYYTRKIEGSKIWFDFIRLDDPEDDWKQRVRYPCFLKPPFLMHCLGQSRIDNEKEMRTALANVKNLMAPYFAGYSEFFRKYLDVAKYPLAVENVVLVEELMEGKQHGLELWADENGKITLFNTFETLSTSRHLLAYVQPQFALNSTKMDALVKSAQRAAHCLGFRNTFFDFEVWMRGDDMILIEINSRVSPVYDVLYRKLWGVSVYRAAVYLACGETEKAKQESLLPTTYQPGSTISGIFYVHTFGEGIGREFIDFSYAEAEDIQLMVSKETPVKQTTSGGFRLAQILLSEHTKEDLFKRVKDKMSKLLLQPQKTLLEEIPA